MSQIDCPAVRAQLSAYLDGDLDQDAAQALLQHAQSCRECTTFLNTFARTVTLYDNLPKPVLSADAQARLKRAVSLELPVFAKEQ